MGHGPHDERDRHLTPWLLIRHDKKDLGLRPVPPGTTTWVSPDLWVTKTADPNAQVVAQPIASQDYFLHARVLNLGEMAAYPVTVDVHWANPSLGFAVMHPIHTAVDVTVPSLGARVVTCPWRPVFENDGHECLFANCTCYLLDPLPAAHYFQPALDRRAAQRNVTVLKGAPGSQVLLRLEVNNPLPAATGMQLGARLQRLAIAPDVGGIEPEAALGDAIGFATARIGTRDELRGRFRREAPPYRLARRVAALAPERPAPGVALVELEGLETPAVAIDLGEPRAIEAPGPREGLDLLARARGWFAADDAPERGYQLVRELSMEGGEQRLAEVAIAIPGDAIPGEIIVCHLTQRGGVAIGGYTVAVIVGG